MATPGAEHECGTAARPTFFELACAWGVHLLTASGAVFGLLAMISVAGGNDLASLWWMIITVAIDGVDGALARHFRVKTLIPSVDGALLDNVVDYFTWSVVPAFFLCMTPLAGEWWRYPVAAAILVASGFQFARTDAKTEDHAFSGFPSYWNIVVFYMVMLRTPVWLNVAVLLLCAAGSFLPVRCLYPSRTPQWRGFNVAFGSLWALCLVLALLLYPKGNDFVRISWVYVAYYVVVSARLTLDSMRTSSGGGAA